MFCLMWGLGGSYDQEERKTLEAILKGIRSSILPSGQESYFDWFLEMKETGVEWKPVMTEKWVPPSRIQFS